MANRFHGNLTGNGKLSGGVESGAAQGTRSAPSFPERTASWPGLPGKSGPDRANGVAKHGRLGEFYAYSQFSPPKLGTGARFKALSAKLSKEPGVTDPDALAAAIGRKKYGSARMAKMSAAGRKKS